MSFLVPKLCADMDPELKNIIEIRREFHGFPELAFAEFWTTAKICERLESLGYELMVGRELCEEGFLKKISLDAKVREKAYDEAAEQTKDKRWIKKIEGHCTGVIAHIKANKVGPTFGFRFDIDGLPIQESLDPSHLPFREGFVSRNANMHACGHDGHIAIGLELARKISENLNSLSGEYYLIFQPAEEAISIKGSGAEVFAQLDLMKKIDYFFSLHLGIFNERKIICGLSFLSLKKYNVQIRGKSIHAATAPEKGANALLAACCAVNNLYTISRHSEGVTRINVGNFFSNNLSNIVSDNASFQFEVRGETNTICEYMSERALSIIEGVSSMYNVESSIVCMGEYSSVDNSPSMINEIRKASVKAGIPDGAIIDSRLSKGSEDAGFLMNEVLKSGGEVSYLCLGCPTRGGHHNPQFDFDEDMLLWGVNILWGLIHELQGRNKKVCYLL